MTIEEWKINFNNISNKINTKFGHCFLSSKLFERADDETAIFYEHNNKKFLLEVNFLYINKEENPVIISILERTKKKFPKVISEIEFPIKNEQDIINKINTYINEMTLKGMFQ